MVMSYCTTVYQSAGTQKSNACRQLGARLPALAKYMASLTRYNTGNYCYKVSIRTVRRIEINTDIYSHDEHINIAFYGTLCNSAA